MKNKNNSKSRSSHILTVYTLVVSLVCFFVVTVVIIFGVYFKNFGITKIYIDNAKGTSGDFVEVPINIKNNHGLWGGQLIIDYDSDNFSFISVETGNVLDECEVNDTGDSVVVLATQSKLSDSKKNGEIATIKFKIKVGADRGAYNLAINDDSNFCNVNEEIVDIKLVDGKIIVK